mgnify:FL=1
MNSEQFSENAFVTVDRDWMVTSFNDQALQLLGCDELDLTGRHCTEIFCGDHRFAGVCTILDPVVGKQRISDIKAAFPDFYLKSRSLRQARLVLLPGDDDQFLGAYIGFTDAIKAQHIHSFILDSIATGVFTIDADQKITSFNKSAEEITGWKEHEVLGKMYEALFHPSTCGDACMVSQSGRQIVGGTQGQDIFITLKDQRVIPVTMFGAPLRDIHGNVVGGVETFADITARIENYMILSSVADGVFAVDRDWRITSFNAAAERMTGWSRSEVIGKFCKDVFRSSVCGSNCVLAQAIQDGKNIIDQDIFLMGKRGGTLPVCISASPLIDMHGDVVGGVETFRDNTERLKADLIVDSVADGVFTVDRNWQITSFNRAAEVITGWSRDEAIGQYCSEIFKSSICGKNCAIAESLYSGSPVANRSIEVSGRDGKKIPISISAAPLVDHEGNVVGGVETFRDLTVEATLRKQLTLNYTFDEIISKSASMQRMFQIMPEIARSDSNVLILGDSGTGKELVARALFNASTRNKDPFVVVNCGALPDTLLESELFGYKAGAFTDARKDKKGRFAAAEGGTIFLDEIGDIPQSLQVKLLRVLQNKVYEPLGSNVSLTANVRIIAATNRNLEESVADGTFREDLYYRLNVVKINLPPLRERMEDIPLLIEHFVDKFRAEKGKDIVGVSPGVLSVLMHYKFPGNIRELENIIEYAFILCPGGMIQEAHLPEPFVSDETGGGSGVTVIGGEGQTLEEIEKQAVLQALERNEWKKMLTCRELNISKDTLRRKIKNFGLKDRLGAD